MKIDLEISLHEDVYLPLPPESNFQKEKYENYINMETSLTWYSRVKLEIEFC